MKQVKSKVFLTVIVMAILAAVLSISVFAADSDIFESLNFKANKDDSNTVIYTQTIDDGTRYLFLPSSADLSSLTLYFENADSVSLSANSQTVQVQSGVAFDFTALAFDASASEYPVTISYNGTSASFIIMKSSGVRSMYLVSDDKVTMGREWVDTDKSNEATGKMSFVGTDGKVQYSNSLTSLKGRGNSTFTDYVKKPYQIKIAKKAALINGDKNEASKKWVLLANAAESTLVHNAITFDLAKTLGMAYTPNFDFIDLYYDGEYRGSYLLTEKTEVDSSRVDVEDTDKLIEKANETNPAYINPTVITATTSSAGNTVCEADSNGSYKYVEGLSEPAFADGASHHAYLLEVEYLFRYPDELTGFVTSRGQSVVTKNPEYLTKEMGAYISSFWQDFENAVYSSDGYNAETGKYYYDYCDMDSLVKLYLINELGKNYDSFCSSAYFYMDADSDILYAGPVWDYDICYGIGHKNRTISSNPEKFFASQKYLINGLLKIESFRDAVKATLDSQNGEFYNAVQTMLGEDGTIAKYSSLVASSQKMNFKMWDITDDYSTVVKSGADKTYENSVDFLQYFVNARINWLSSTTAQWNGESYSIPTDPVPSNDIGLLGAIKKIINLFKAIFLKIISLFK